MEEMNRREFLMTSALFTAACSSGSHDALTSPPPVITPPYTLPTGATILFQGDSVVAADRSAASSNPNDAPCMGTGFALNIAQHLLLTQPTKGLKFYNRGNGGDGVPELQARWQTDTLDLHPDLVSILVGTNDVAHGQAASYEQNLTNLVNSTLNALPHVKIVIMEPYAVVSPANAGAAVDLPTVQAAASRVAAAAGAVFVPLQSMFNTLVSQESAAYWLADGEGAHPSIAGSAAIANQWIDKMGF